MRLQIVHPQLRLRQRGAKREPVLLWPGVHLRKLHLPDKLRLSKGVILYYRPYMDRMDRPSHVETALRAHRSEFKRFVAARAHADNVDDVLQMAAIRALENASSLKDPDRVVAWLYQIHRNAVTDFARQQMSEQRKRDALAMEPEPEMSSSEADQSEACGCSLEQARQLNTRYSSVLELVDIGGATLKDAARSLGLSVNAATVRLHRARKALKERLMAHCGVETMRGCNDCRCTNDGCCPT